MNHSAGSFVCPYCSASRKRAHESAQGYFTRCNIVLNQTVCARACVRDGDSRLSLRGCSLSFMFYGLCSTDRLGVWLEVLVWQFL